MTGLGLYDLVREVRKLRKDVDRLLNGRPQVRRNRSPVTGRPRCYPWELWLDGQERELVRGIDYDSQTKSFAQYVRAWCRERGIEVEIHQDSVTDIVTVKAIKET